MRVLVFGTYDVRMHPRVGVLAAGLAEAGADVVECNEPLGLSTAARVRILRQPWRLPLLAWRIAHAWARLATRARREPQPDVVLVGYLGHFDVLLARLLFRRTTIALDHLVSASDTAQDRGERGGLKQLLLRALDRRATSTADVVIVDTDEHVALIPGRHRHKALVAPVGAPDDWFAARGPVAAHTGPLRVVFFGAFAPLQGAPVVATALAQLPPEKAAASMIGHGQDHTLALAAAGGVPNIEWRGWLQPEALPALVATYDVCLGIFGTSDKALRVVPNKVFQGAAAGCAIVTSDTAPQRRALGDAAVYVQAGDPTALAMALLELADDPGRLADLRRRAAEHASANFTPAAVSAALHGHLRDIVSAKISAS